MAARADDPPVSFELHQISPMSNPNPAHATCRYARTLSASMPQSFPSRGGPWWWETAVWGQRRGMCWWCRRGFFASFRERKESALSFCPLFFTQGALVSFVGAAGCVLLLPCKHWEYEPTWFFCGSKCTYHTLPKLPQSQKQFHV